MYTTRNFRTKKQLKEAVANGETVTIFQPNAIPGVNDGPIADDDYSVEGPHYPEPHRWYAAVRVRGGRIVKVIG